MSSYVTTSPITVQRTWLASRKAYFITVDVRTPPVMVSRVGQVTGDVSVITLY